MIERCTTFESNGHVSFIEPRITWSPKLLRRQATKTLRSFRAREKRVGENASIVPSQHASEWYSEIEKGKFLIRAVRDAINNGNLRLADRLLIQAQTIQTKMNRQSFKHQYDTTTPKEIKLQKVPSTVGGKPIGRRRALVLAAAAASTTIIEQALRPLIGEAAPSEGKPLEAVLLIFQYPTKVYLLGSEFYSTPLRDGRHAVHVLKEDISEKYLSTLRTGEFLIFQAIRQDPNSPILTEHAMRVSESGYLPVDDWEKYEGQYQPVELDIQITDKDNRAIYDAAIWFDGSKKIVYTDAFGQARKVEGYHWRDVTEKSRAHIKIKRPDGSEKEIEIADIHGGRMGKKLKIQLSAPAEDQYISQARLQLEKRLRSIPGMDNERVRGALDLFNAYAKNGPEVSEYLVDIAEEFARLNYPQPSTPEAQEILGHYGTVSSAKKGENGELLDAVIADFINKHMQRHRGSSIAKTGLVLGLKH